MQTMNWLWAHLGSIDQVIKLLNESFCWNLSIVQGGSHWFVRAGDQEIFSADNRDAIDAFLYGMGLSLSSIPEPIFSGLTKDMKQWCETHS